MTEYVTIIKLATHEVETKPLSDEFLKTLAHYTTEPATGVRDPRGLLDALRAGEAVYAGMGNAYLHATGPEGAPEYRVKLAIRRWELRNYWRYIEECKRRYPGGSLSS